MEVAPLHKLLPMLPVLTLLTLLTLLSLFTLLTQWYMCLCILQYGYSASKLTHNGLWEHYKRVDEWMQWIVHTSWATGAPARC